MPKAVRDVAELALMGLVLGLMLGVLAAGLTATWVTGGDLANVGFGTILAFAPWEVGGWREPFQRAVTVGGAVALAVTCAVPALAYRRPLTSHGSARWATPEELRRAALAARLADLKGPIYGKLGTPRRRAPFLTSPEIPHSLIAAPTGSGKGIGVVIPTLLTYPGSVICLDVKGENFAKTARRRLSMDDQVYKFAPYDPEGRTHRYNPLDEVVAAPLRRRYARARALASGLIVAKRGGEGFLGGAWDLFAATALLVIQRGTPTIGAIYDALSEPGEAYVTLRRLAEEARAPEAKKILGKMSALESKILSSYMSVLDDGGLSLWADPLVRDVTSASDFSLHGLRRDPASIYVVVAPNDLATLAPLVRLLFQQAVAIVQSAEPDLAKGETLPVLFLLDEFVSLGRMDDLARAMTTLRGFGGRAMIVVQTLASLRDLYGRDGASVFLANCRMQLFMAPADEETPDYISRAAGDYTRRSRAKSWRGGEMATSYSERVEGARLMRPEQVRMLGEGRVLALVQNQYPVLAHRVSYLEDRELAPLFHAQEKKKLPEPPALGPSEPEPEAAAVADGAMAPGAHAAAPEADAGRARPKRAPAPAPDPAPRPDAPGAQVETATERPAAPPAAVAAPAGKEMDEETEREVYAGLGHVSVDQARVLDVVVSALSQARRRNRARIAGGVEEGDDGEGRPADPTGPNGSDGQPRPASHPEAPAPGRGEVSDILRAARDANRDRGEAPGP